MTQGLFINPQTFLKNLFLLLALTLVSFSFSQKTFDNDSGDLLWSTPSNWSDDILPTATDSVIISGYIVTLSSTTTVESLSLISNASRTRIIIDNGTINVNESVYVTMSDTHDNTNIVNDENGIINVLGDVIFTREVSNSNNSEFSLINRENADLNITGNLEYHYLGAHTDNNSELRCENTATIDIDGDLIMHCSGDVTNSLRAYFSDSSTVTINGSVDINQSNGTQINILTDSYSTLSVGDDLIIETSYNTNNLFIEANGANASISVGDSIILNQTGGTDIELRSYNNANFTVGGSILSTKTGGDDIEFEVNSGGTFTVTGDIVQTMTSDGGTDNLNFYIDEATFSVNDITLTSTNACTSEAVLNIQIDGSTFTANNIEFNQEGGTDGDVYFYLNENDQSIGSTLNIANDLTFNHSGGDNIIFRIYDNSVTTIGGDLNFISTSSDGDDIAIDWRGDNASLTITGDVIYEINGTQSNEDFDLDVDADFTFLCEDFFLDLNGGRDFSLEIGPNNLGDGGSFTISDSLIIDHEGASDDILFRLHANGNDHYLEIGTVYAEVSADGGDYIEFETNNELDSLIINNNLYIKTSGGTYDTEDDLRIDLNDGVLTVSGDVHLEIDGGDALSFNANNTTINIVEDLNLLLTDGNDAELIVDGSTLTIGDSLIIYNNGDANYTDNEIDDNSIVNIGSSWYNTNVDGTRFYTRIGLNGSNTANVSVGEDLVINNLASSGNSIINQYDGSKLTIVRDYIVTNTCDGSGDYHSHYLDEDDDTLIVGNDLIWSMSGGTAGTDDDLRFDMDGGYVDISGKVEAISTGGDDINFTLDGGYMKISSSLEITSTSDLTLRLDNDSLVVESISTFTVNNGTSSNIDINSGNHSFNEDLSIHSNNSTGNINYDQDGGTVSLAEDFYITANGVNVTQIILDNGSTLNITDSLKLDLDECNSEGRIYLDENSGTGSSISVSNIFIDHEGDAHDLRILTNENSNLNVSNNIFADWVADDNDWFELRMDGPSDTIIIANDLILNFTHGSQNGNDEPRIYNYNSGLLSIGNDLDIDVNDGGATIISNTSTGTISIANDMNLNLQNSQGFSVNIDDGNINIGNDFYVQNNGQLNTSDPGWDLDGGSVTVGGDFICRGDTTRRFYIQMDNASTLSVADSMIFDIDSANATNYINLGSQDNGPSSELTIGSSLHISGTSTAYEFRIYMDRNSKIDIANDLIANWDSERFFEIELGSDDDDTLLIGNDILVTKLNGNTSGNAHLYFDMDGGYANIGNDVIYNSKDGDNINFQIASGDLDINGALTLSNEGGDQILFDLNAGTVDVTEDITFQLINCTNRFNYDQDGGVLTANEDINIYLNGLTESDFRLDYGSIITIADSLILDLDLADNSFEFYLDEDAGTESSIYIGSNFVVDQEAGFQDLLVKLEGDSKFEVENDIIVNVDASGGDYVEFELNEVTDSLIVGNDMILSMNSGTNNGDDDVRLDFNHGVVQIGRDLDFSNTGGGDTRVIMTNGHLDIARNLVLSNTNSFETVLQQSDGDIDIDGELFLSNTNSRNITINVDAGTLDVLDDIIITQDTSVAGYDISWDQDGGTITAHNDLLVTANGNGASNFRIDNGGLFIVSDSIIVDLNQSTEDFNFYIGEGSTTQAEVLVGASFYIDHEPAADDMHIRMNNNGKLTIANDILVENDADGDYFELSMATSEDTLFVGNDLILKMPSGASNDGDDLFIDIDDGYASIGRDVRGTVNDGGALGFEQNLGTVVIGRYLTLENNGGQNLYFQNYGGTLTVTDDVTLKHQNSRSSSNFSFDLHDGDLNFNSDFYYLANDNNESNFYLDGAYTFDVSDSLILDLDQNNGITRFYLNENGAYSTGGRVTVGSHFYVDHEGAAQDFLLRLEDDAKLDIAQDLTIINDANGGDYTNIELTSDTDSLLIGNDLIMTIPSGSDNAGDDIDIDVSGGLLQVGNDLLMSNTNGGSIRFDHENGTNATTSIGRYMTLTSNSSDDISLNIDGGTITVTDDITIEHINCDNNLNWNQDGGIIYANQDLYLIQNGINEADIRMDNESGLIVADSLSLQLGTSNNSFEFYLNDNASTGAYIEIGNDFYIDHQANYQDFTFKLEGNANLDITDDFVVNHIADGGDHITILIDEDDGNDTLLVGGDINFSMISGSGSGDDDIRLNFDGGYVEVVGDVNISGASNGDDIYIDQDGNSSVYFQGDVNFSAVDINDASWDQDGTGSVLVDGDITITSLRSDNSDISFGGGSSTVSGHVTIDNDDSPHTGSATFRYTGGTNELIGTLDVSTVNPTSSNADARLYLTDGTNTLREVVILTVSTNADEARVQMDGGNTTLEDSLILNVIDNSDNPILDINAGTLTINEDLYINHNASVNLSVDQDGGTINILDDFIYTGTNVGRHYFRIDNGGEFNVSDTLFLDLNDATNRLEFYLDEDDGTGSKLTTGVLYIDHEEDAHDLLMKLEGESVMEITGDFVVENDASDGDFFEFELNTNDTLLIGGSMIVQNIGDDSGGDLNLDINNGYVFIADDLDFQQSPISENNQELRIHLDADSYLHVGDSLILDHNRGANLELYINQNSGDDAYLYAEVIDLDVESDINDLRILLNGQNSKIETSGDFNINFDAANGDYLQIDMDGISNTDSIVVGNDFNINYNNVGSTTNGNNDVRIDSDGGIISVGNDFYMNFLGGNDWETNLDGGASIIVSNDLIMNKDATDEMYIYTGRNAGSGSIYVGNNLDMDHDGTANSVIEIELNNASELDVDGDLNFITTAANDLRLDLNGTSEFRIANAIDRAVNGSEFGEILSESTAIITYDGSTAQTMEEEAGGGGDEIQYGIVRINNTSGLMPAVTLENNLGGSADIYGLYLDEGLLDLNAQTLTVLDGATTAITRTLGSVLSEQTDNSSVLRWEIDANIGTHIFPFGTVSGDYIPFTFDLTAGDAGTVDLATYPTSSANLPFSPTVTNMNHEEIDNTLYCSDRHWQIESSGTPTADITFSYLDSENAAPNTINESDLQAQRWTGTEWETPVGSVNTANNTVTVSGVSTFSPWVLVSNISPLPVSFISFTTDVLDNKTTLNWSTGFEENNSHFNILRSADGLNFETIGTVSGAGQSVEILDYSFIDESPLTGYSYYQIQQIDYDGSSMKSDLELTLFDSGENEVYVYPNPTKGILNISQQHKFEVVNLLGRLVISGFGNKIDLSQLPVGVYVVYVNGEIHRIVKE